MIRLEKKYVINNNNQRLKFIKFLFKKKFRKIFKDRVNFSIYFDYKNLKFYDNSEEGLSFRTKIRLRTEKSLFINDYEHFNFEIKESHPIFKKKYVFLKKEKIENKKILDKKNIFTQKILSKEIVPILSTEYLRSYYFSDLYGRITIDQNLEYQIVTWKNFLKDFNFIKKIKDRRMIIEHKIENKFLENSLITLVPSRFSKYCEGVKKLIF